tara:strand:+ start:1969 stop:4101 length:2133 start_codon:yes stop_codon:yes gene_type:complete
MVWQISTQSGDYNIKNNKSKFYDGTYIDYFTVKENGMIGFNNSDPKYDVDIEGDVNLNGLLHITNLIGKEDQGINIININYEQDGLNSNLFNVYGNSYFNGNVGIGVSNPDISLDVIGNIKCHEIESIGSNVTLINTDNISDGILPVIRGGIGVDNINPLQILIGGVNKIDQNASLNWTPGENKLSATRFKGNGSEIASLDATNISSGILGVSRGGTGRNSFNIKGGILVGNLSGQNQYSLTQTELLKWNNENKNLLVEGNVILPAGSNIIIDGVPLKFDDFDNFPGASSSTKGMIKIFEGDFKFNDDDQLALATQGSSKWTQEENRIWYPSGTPNSTHSVGIGTIPIVTNNYRLDVDGDINTSNGVFKINGKDMLEYTSNEISNRINIFTLDDIAIPEDKPNTISGELESTLNGGWYNKFFSIRDIPDDDVILNTSKEFYISSDPDTYRFTFDNPVVIKSSLHVTGTIDLSKASELTIKSLDVESSDANSILKINQIYNNVIDSGDHVNSGSIINLQRSSETQLRINKDGFVGIGTSPSLNFEENIGGISIDPVERLHVIGNIVSTGFITAYYSDNRLKDFISNIDKPLEIINNLKGYYYKPNDIAVKNGFNNDKEIGLSAQDVQKVLPEIVKLAPFDIIRDKNGKIISKSGENYLTICYEKMAPVFVEAIKEISKQLETIKNENKELKKENKEIKDDIIKIKSALNLY